MSSKIGAFAKVVLAAALAAPVAGCQQRAADTAQLQTSSREAQLDQLVNDYAVHGHLSGSLYVRFADGSTWQRGVQLADDEERRPNGTDTLDLIASCSKSYTAAAVLKLEEMRRLSVDDPVAKYFPEYPPANLTGPGGHQVTIHHLLSHTSGLPEAYDDERIDRKLYREDIDIDEIVDAVKEKPLTFEPGERFEYSNTGYILLGEIVRRVSGQSYGEFAQARLFQPLGLEKTFVGMPDDRLPGLAVSYEKERLGRSSYVVKHHIKKMHVTDTFTDGNIVATAEDVASWARGLAGERLLSRASLAKMFTDYGANYGYGWDVGVDPRVGRLIWHNGGWVGYESAVIHAPDTGATIAYLLNQEMPERMSEQFQKRLKDIVFSAGD